MAIILWSLAATIAPVGKMPLPIPATPPPGHSMNSRNSSSDPRALRSKVAQQYPHLSLIFQDLPSWTGFCGYCLDFSSSITGVGGNPSLTRNKVATAGFSKANSRITLACAESGIDASQPADCGVSLRKHLPNKLRGRTSFTEAKEGRALDVAWRGSVSSHFCLVYLLSELSRPQNAERHIAIPSPTRTHRCPLAQTEQVFAFCIAISSCSRSFSVRRKDGCGLIQVAFTLARRNSTRD